MILKTLLYTLLDLTQNSHHFIPVCVIGVSCRPDVVDLLEKRVRSRLSPLHLKFNNDWQFDEYFRWTEDLLSVHQSSISSKANNSNKREIEAWNKDIKKWMRSDIGHDFILSKFKTNKSIGYLKNYLAVILSQMPEEINSFGSYLQSEYDATWTIPSSTNDYREEILKDLSLLELCICIGIKHLITEDYAESFNFEMLFLEFRKFQNKKNMMLKCSKTLLMQAFEHLESLELIRPISDTAGRHLQRSFRLMNAQFDWRLVGKIVEDKESKVPAAIKNWYSNRL